MQAETRGRILTWILLSAAALGQLLITAGFMRQDTDLITPDGKSIPISYIDIRFYGHTADVLGVAVIVFVGMATILCFGRRAYATLGAIFVSILLYATFLSAFFTVAEQAIWLYGVGFVLVCIVGPAIYDSVVIARRRPVPDSPEQFVRDGVGGMSH